MPKNKRPVEKINGDFTGKDIVSLDQFLADDIKLLFSKVPEMKKLVENHEASNLLAGRLVTLLFFEPSSRTFGSFAAAVKRLGMRTIEIQNPDSVSSVSKGESFSDTIKVFENYSDMIVIRAKEKGKAEEAAKAAFFIPVINAGDGIGEHPTQALLDMYTIFERFGRLDNLTGVIVGDLKNGRTVHSLLRGISLFPNNTLYLLSPRVLKLAPEELQEFKKRGLTLIEISSVEEIPKNAKFWYWTRVQKERFVSLAEYEKVKNTFILTKKLLNALGNKDMIIMHPLPRVGEIAQEVDDDPRAVYLTTQMRNGLFVRMALLSLILSKK